jgi:uncharacterized protein
MKIHMVDQLRFMIPALLETIPVEQDMICRVMGDCLFGPALDAEIGVLDTPSIFAPREQKFSYVRYDRSLELPGDGEFSRLSTDLDNVKLMPFLQRIGRQYAAENVRREHLYSR